MPYDVLPARLRDIIPSENGQEMFRNVVNSQLEAGKSESVAMASAWAALQRAGYDKDENGKWVKKVQPTLSQVHVPGAEWNDEDEDKPRRTSKRTLNDDTFTTPEEAMVRSIDLGLGGAVHVHQTADGMAVYMPGEDHENYLEAMAERAGIVGEDEDESPDVASTDKDLLTRAVMAIMRAIMEQSVEKRVTILKADDEQRIVWGWASVATVKGMSVLDHQGDMMTPDEMVKMANRFMESARAAKAMHAGDQIGEVIHSLPLTAELAKALGIEADREGWIIGMKIRDDAMWQSVKSGDFGAFSIGGRAKREALV